MFKRIFDKKHRSRTISYLIVIFAYIILELLLKTGSISSRFKSLLVPTTCYIVVAIALNMVVGISGELSLGHAGFMCVGAFTGVCVSGILSSSISNEILILIISIIVGAIVAGIFGLLISIPVLKLEGDYLAIVTLAFCQIIQSLIMNVYLGFDSNGLHFSFVEKKFELLEGGKFLLEGPMGASGTNRIANFTAGIILIIVALVIAYNLIYSKNGRAIMASRDNRIAATSVGVNVTKVKTLIFVLSACLAGAAGALYSMNYSTLTASKFDFNLSILILVYVVLGGLGNITGTIIATTALILIPELLRSIADYRLIIYSIILIATMLITNNSMIKKNINEAKDKITRRHGND